MRKIEAALVVAVFLDLLGFGMLVADVQLRAERAVPRGWPVGAVVGAALAITFVVQTVASPRWGRFSDRVGRKPVLVVCSLLSGAAMLVYGVVPGLLGIVLSRLLSGLGAANVAIAQAYVADAVPGPGRTAVLGRLGAGLSAGLIVGPVLGGWLSHVDGSRAVGLVAAGASLLGAVLLFAVLPVEPPRSPGPPVRRPIFDLSLLREVPGVRRLFAISAVAWFSLATLEGTFARLIHRLFGYGTLEFGWLFAYESAVAVLLQGAAVGWVVARFGQRRTLRAAFAAQGAGLALNPLAGIVWPPLAMLFAASTLYAAGSGLQNPVVSALASERTPEARQGELFGLMQGARSLGFVLGPVVGGTLFDLWPPAPYLLAGVVCLAAAALVE